MNHQRTRRRPAPAIAVLITALLVAGCGSSSATSSSASSSSSSSAAGAATGAGVNRSKLVACLEQHGVTLPARPAGARRRPPGAGGYGGVAPGVFGGAGGAGAGGAGAGGAGAGGGFANNPKLRAAFQACGGGAFRSRRASFDHAAVTKFAACVSRHGYKLPAPNFSGKGPVFPAKIASSKRFQAASRACASLLRPTRPPAGSSGGTSTGSASGTTTT
jgi:hypothetical protein